VVIGLLSNESKASLQSQKQVTLFESVQAAKPSPKKAKLGMPL
jgi:hypothetical protein